MKAINNMFLAAIACSLAALGGCLAHPVARSTYLITPTSADASLDKLKKDLADSRIASMEVLFLDYSKTTRSRVTPDWLNSNADFVVVVKSEGKFRESLAEALEKTRIGPMNGAPDLRWGVHFLDRDGGERHSIYLNGRYITGTGRRGVIDGQNVRLNTALIGWCETHFMPR